MREDLRVAVLEEKLRACREWYDEVKYEISGSASPFPLLTEAEREAEKPRRSHEV